MARAILLLLSGAIAGSGLVYLSLGGSQSSGGTPFTRDSVSVPESPSPSSAAPATSPAELESMIERLLTAPASIEQETEIEALLARLGEIDPRRAVQFAESRELKPRLLSMLIRTRAAADADVALAAFAGVRSPLRQRAFALALLEALGNDPGNVERVAAAMPAVDRPGFRVDALVARAAQDLVAALEGALAEENAVLQRLAVGEIAVAAARSDAQAALARAGLIADADLRRTYEIYLLREWIGSDPEAVIALIETVDAGELPATISLFGITLAASHPERMLALVDRLPTEARSDAQRSALQALAERDPLAALARLEDLPPGADRSDALRRIAQAYGHRNPEAALAWAKALAPPSREAIRGVFQGIAEVDVDRAMDVFVLELENPSAPGVRLSPSVLVRPLIATGVGNVGRILDRLLAIDADVLAADPATQSTLSSTLSAWAQTDADGALQWALANADRLETDVWSGLAPYVARENPELAIRVLDQLPAGQREGSLPGIASGLAQSDLEGATRLIEGYRGQPGYEVGLNQVALQWVIVDPSRAARLIAETLSSPATRTTAGEIAREWASRDPSAAMSWALGVSDESSSLRSYLIEGVTSTWATSDADGARRWLTGRPSGAERDRLLNNYLSARAVSSGSLDTRVLDAYSTDAARQQGASLGIVAAVSLGRGDLAEARRLMEVYVTDPALRRQTEEQLARIESGQGFFNVTVAR